MSVIAQILNGTNLLNRDAGFSSLISAYVKEGVRSGFGNDIAVSENQVDTGMAFIEVTRTAVTPNEVFLMPVWIDVAEVIDTSGDGYIILLVDQDKINDGSADNADGTGIVTVEKVSALPTSNYIELASLSSGVITDTRTPLSIDIAKVIADDIEVDAISEKTADNGVLIDEVLSKDGYFDMPEQASDPVTPASTHWRLFFKGGGAYVIDDNGSVYKIQVGGSTTESKSESEASNGELFENTDQGNTLGWKTESGIVVDIEGDVWEAGEVLGANDALSAIFVKTQTTNINPEDDTYVDELNPSTNYSTVDDLYLRDYEGHDKNALFSFNSDDLDIDNVIRIVSFEIKFYQSLTGQTQAINAFPISSSWTPSSVNWNTKPTYGSSIGYISSYVNGWNTIVAEPSDAEWENIKTYGIALITNPGQTPYIDSLENSSGNNLYIDNIIYVGYDGKLYKHKAGYQEAYDELIGFAPSYKASGALFVPKKSGDTIIESTTRGETYYLSTSVDGGIETTSSSGKKVGTGTHKGASSALNILIDNN